jgi:hypothetical protein
VLNSRERKREIYIHDLVTCLGHAFYFNTIQLHLNSILSTPYKVH